MNRKEHIRIVFFLAIAASYAGVAPSVTVAAELTVDATSDTVDANPGDGVCADGGGSCSLRAAIQEANALAGTDTISFNIPGGGTHTIRPTTELPAITEPATVDGYTQPGSSLNSNGAGLGSNAVLTIELDGSWAGVFVEHALRIDSGGSAIRGLVINRFPQRGIVLTSGGGNTIAGNFIGTNTTGTSDLGNTFDGVYVSSPGNTIGGTTAEARNIISGNNGSGVLITGSATGNFVRGNFIGTNSAGTADLGNLYDGVRVLSNGNTIGGTTPEAGNVISGNDGTGIVIDGSNNVVQGNLIGTQVNGSSARGNGENGVWIGGANRNNTTVGGAVDGEENTIAFNTASGVIAIGGTGHEIQRNAIFSNGGLGIDLGGSGVTANDAGDSDTGANNFQNFPVLTAATRDNGTTVVEGTLDSTPDTEFHLEFFSNPSCDSSGFGEGQVYLGSETVVTNGNGDASFTVVLASEVLQDHVVTATATDPGGNTSEFSQCIDVGGPVTFVVNSNTDTNDGSCNAAHCSLREAISAANSHTGSKDIIAFNISGSGPHSIQVETQMPEIVQPVIIDGYTQPGASPNSNGPALGSNAVLMIELKRGAWPGGCLRIRAGNSTVRGLVINSFNNDPIVLYSQGGNVIEGNFIGPDPTGTVNLGNQGSGVLIQADSHNNIVGGTTPAARNLLSGNSWGVQIRSTGNSILGNLIGTDILGTTALASGVTGVLISDTGNTVGGLTPEERNVISGMGMGVSLSGAGATGNTIQGNFIGTDVTGTSAIANVYGVRISSGASDNTVGGVEAGAGNVISGNSTGADIYGSTTTGNVFWGNLIGTDLTGIVDVGNSGGITIASPGNTVGGTGAGEGNVISGNSTGVSISGANSAVEGNLIGTDITGTADLGNYIGVNLSGTNNIVGGTSAPARNVISGNTIGVYISGGNGNFAQGNFIGADPSGTVALPNIDGVKLQNGASGNTIGGTVAGAGNVISGNLSRGIEIVGFTSSANVIQGNLIGTDPSGTVSLSNGSQGVRMSGAPDTVVGGTEPDAGNVISGNGGVGVEVCGATATGNMIQGNIIGLDISGTIDLGNAQQGVVLCDQAAGNTIGGSTSNARNVISGNSGIGIDMSQGASGNEVLGNFIGTDSSGTMAIGNDQTGIKLRGPNNTIGGTTIGAGNLVSGNVHHGIWIDSGSNGTVVQGNLIGTDITGSIDLGNSLYGLQIGNASGCTVGGTTASARNVISGNDRAGLYLFGTGASGNSFQGNLIGTQIDGVSPLGNGQAGVEIQSAVDNTIGGTVPGAGNTIAFNGGNGLFAVFGTGNAFRSNSIFANAGLGIELRGSSNPYLGVTPNDPGDSDTGTNNLQNFPDVTEASSGGGITVIKGSLDSAMETDYAVDFYANAECDPSGHGEGEQFLGSTLVSIGLSNPQTIVATVMTEAPVGDFVTATATDPLGNTSEFSACVVVVNGDCNNNGAHDYDDIATGTSTDCNANGIPDDCDIDPTDPDGNGQVSGDADANGLPDECLSGDLDGNGAVDLDDFVVFVFCVTDWGVPPPPGCGLADLDGDGDIDLVDFQAFQTAFGLSGP